MKKNVLFVLILIVPFIVFSQNSVSINKSLNEFSAKLIDTLPNTATQTGMWPDAWIGNITPSDFPHAGAGLSFGLAQIDTQGFSAAAQEVGVASSSDSALYLPTAAFDLRLGGFVLPFDFGASFLALNKVEMDDNSLFVDFLSFSSSIRYAIIEGDTLLPRLSAGIGYSYYDSSISSTSGKSFITVKSKAHVLFAETQISKQIAYYFTPYANVRLLFSDIHNDWSWASNVIQGQGVSNKQMFSDPVIQVGVGTGINYLFGQASVGITYDFAHEILGVHTAIRFIIPKLD